MPPQISAYLAAQDALYCMGLGVGVVLLRLVLPAQKHRFYKEIFDFLAVLFCCVLLQGYAARYADAGQLRWYHGVGAALGALGMQQTVGRPVGAAKRSLQKRLRPVFLAPKTGKKPRPVKNRKKL